jgi:tetratricopeptide (TPR) repeat protein
MVVNGDVAAVRYKAYISYSHGDAAAARWLHRALEGYRVPRRLVGRRAARGEIGRRLGKVFRDREEPAVTDGLSGRANEALQAAEFLIVLCSPAAAASRRVNEEVINFKRLRSADSIMAVIVDGEPHASVIPGREAQECFVPALRFAVDADGGLTKTSVEPIAADLRAGKDGRRLAKLKILAGLLGIGLDELALREQQRRQGWLLAVTAAAFAGVAVMAGLTAAALNARNVAQLAQERAERQRAQAEGLVEFMLGDLRDKLQPLGRLEVLDATASRSLEYFASLRDEEIGPDTIGRRARTLHLIGEIDTRRGNLPKARSLFEQARKLTARSLAAAPRDPERIFEHAQSVFWIGNLDWQTGNLPAAEKGFEEYARLATVLVGIDARSIRWLKESGYASINLGVVRFQQRQHDLALTAFTRAAERFTQLAALAPAERDFQLTRAQVSAWIADTHRARGAFEAALAERERERGVYTKLLEADPAYSGARQFLPVVELAMGRLMLDLGRADAAIASLREAAEDAGKLALSDPQNAEWRELEIRTRTELAEAQTIDRDCIGAAASTERALEVLDASLQSDSVFLTVLGARLLAARARCRLLQGDADGALIAASAALDALGADGEAAGGPELAAVAAEAWLLKGDAQATGGSRDLAASSWGRALELTGRLGGEARPFQRLLRAITLERLDRAAAAQAILGELQAINYRHPLISDRALSSATNTRGARR